MQEFLQKEAENILSKVLINVNTKNILFIVGGAFEGIDKIIASRINKNKMGFSSDEYKIINMTRTTVLNLFSRKICLSYGLIPELIGRIPVVAPLHQLSRDAFKSILTDPKNAILKQYKKLFMMEGVELEFDPFAIELQLLKKQWKEKQVPVH